MRKAVAFAGPRGQARGMEIADLIRPGQPFEVRVTPRARNPGIALVDGVIHVRVTAPPEGGKANRAVAEALARALGVARSRLTLVRGAKARTKVFCLD